MCRQLAGKLRLFGELPCKIWHTLLTFMLIIWNIYLSLFFCFSVKLDGKGSIYHVWASLTWTLPSQRPPPPATTARAELQRFVDGRGRTLSRFAQKEEKQFWKSKRYLRLIYTIPEIFFLTKYIQNTRSGCGGWKRRDGTFFASFFAALSLHCFVPSYESLQMPIGAVANEPYQESYWEFSCQIQSISARNCTSLKLLFSRPFPQEIFRSLVSKE